MSRLPIRIRLTLAFAVCDGSRVRGDRVSFSISALGSALERPDGQARRRLPRAASVSGCAMVPVGSLMATPTRLLPGSTAKELSWLASWARRAAPARRC